MFGQCVGSEGGAQEESQQKQTNPAGPRSANPPGEIPRKEVYRGGLEAVGQARGEEQRIQVQLRSLGTVVTD